MEPVSLMLAIPQLLNSCLQGYRSFESIRDLGKDVQILQCKLKIQETRLAAFGESLDLSDGAVVVELPKLLEAPILNTLESIKRLTTDIEFLRKKYKLDVVVQDYSSDKREPREVLGGMNNTEKLPERYTSSTISSSSSSIIRLPMSKLRLVKWLAVDKDNLGQLATDLKDLNDGLEDLLQVAQRSRFQKSFRAFCLRTLNTDDVSNLRTVAEASTDSYIELASPAMHKAIRLDAENSVDSSQLSAPLFDPVAFSKPASEQSGRTTVMHLATREMVVLEWRNLPIDFPASVQALKRLQLVANLLRAVKPPTMRTLGCMGYVQDLSAEQASLVSQFPAGAGREAPRSLLDFLESPEKRNALPSLNDRYALALKLAQTVFHLHMSGWLHKSIRSQNVLFFSQAAPTPSSTAGPPPKGGILRDPYLTGFEFSREGALGMGTETVVETPEFNRYRHPNCQGPVRGRFKKAYDLYSLGMVLLEIGCWKTFNKYPLYKSTVSASENCERIMRLYLAGDVAYYAGEEYEKVILACLTGDFGADLLEGADFQQQVYEAVVKPLAGLAGEVI